MKSTTDSHVHALGLPAGHPPSSRIGSPALPVVGAGNGRDTAARTRWLLLTTRGGWKQRGALTSLALPHLLPHVKGWRGRAPGNELSGNSAGPAHSLRHALSAFIQAGHAREGAELPEASLRTSRLR